jgi:hypothetical protein
MAQIPEAIPLDQVQGQELPPIAPAPTDFGFGQAGQEFEHVAMAQRRVGMMQIRAQAAQARQDALTSPQFQQFNEADAKSFAEDAGAWDPSKPGFATDQVTKVQSRLAQAQSDYAAAGATPGQLSEFRTLGLQQVARRGAEANQYEQTELMRQAGQVQETAANGFKSQIIAAWGPAKQKLYDGYDGSSPTLVPQTASAFDAAAQPVIASAPPALQDRLRLEASVMKESAVAEAGEVQGHAQTAYVVTQADNQASTLINSVVSNPLAYDDVMKQLPSIAATLPAGQIHDKALTTWQNAAAKGRVNSLIDNQQYGQALTELNDKRYDPYLLDGEKDQLEARAMAESREHGPQAVDRAIAAKQASDNMEADAYARATTGKGTGFDYDAAASNLALPPEAVAAGKVKAMRADQAFAATGSVHEWSPTQLQAAAAAAPPDPAAPDYTNNLFVWQAQRDAAAAELKARQEPGAWAFSAGKVPAKPGAAAGDAAGQDRGALLQQKWQTFVTAPPAGRMQAGGDYAGWMLGSQASSGIPAGQMQILPQAQAGQLAAAVTQAPAEGKLAAYSNLAGIMSGLPAAFRMPDGSTAAPRQILIGQLRAAKMSAMDISAIVDSGGDPARIGAYVAALNDPTLKGAAAGKDVGKLTAAVRAQLAPYMATASSPADEALNQGRLDRINLEARELMATQHLSPPDAAARAAADITGGYAFMHGWRMPAAAAAAPVNMPPQFSLTDVAPMLGGQMRGDQAANLGSAHLLAQMTGNGGAALYAPSTIPGAPADRQRIFASQVTKSGAWKTLPDDSGLALMIPKPDGTWSPVADKFGRPVQASWSQLQGVAAGQPSPFAAPPPNQPKGPDGAPIPAFSAGKGFDATVWGVTGAESRFKTGAVGPQTPYGQALGIMQVIPQFAQPYAQRLFGAPLDVHRLQWDDGYNRQIGSAMLADNIKRYGSTGPGLALAIAAYNAGTGNVEGYRDAAGYHKGLIQRIGDPRQPGGPSLNDWIPRVDIKETREYLQKVLPAAFSHLQGQ